jgi:predicted nuclease of predicted toxin-antitoxin system
MVDESTGPRVAKWRGEHGSEVFSVYEQARGLDDDSIIAKAFDDNWILITNDKDFGEKVYREHRPHRGIVLLRLRDESATSKIKTLHRLLETYANQLADCFVVISETRERFARR